MLLRFLFLSTLSASAFACSAPATPASDAPSRAETYLDCLRENGFTMLAAHRAGPAPGIAENSIEAIRRAGALGAAMVEIDVMQTADGHLILMHDRTLDRTTTGRGAIAEARLADLEPVRLRDPDGAILDAGIPTFSEALEIAVEVSVIPQLDLKGVSIPDAIAALDAAGARDQAALIAYTPEQALEAWRLAPDLMLSAPDSPDELAHEGFNFSTSYTWLGVGRPDPDRDAALAERGIESSAGLFRLEDGQPEIYQEAAAAGVEILSVDDVATASTALGGADALRRQHAHCLSQPG